jgi:hypothetical protein
MSEMVERVARAIEAAREANPYMWHPDTEPARMYESIARAAIEAMREPTEEMLAVMRRKRLMGDRAAYIAGIDAALKEPA